MHFVCVCAINHNVMFSCEMDLLAYSAVLRMLAKEIDFKQMHSIINHK